ncbi:MAG: helix-turn-helix transcriptional regulator [Alcanivoracaceae bacterium]|uniref:response regulator transcription factor n=1 Tax=Alcanivorax sp. MD8A TaxID=1177157 RepID=UPI000C590F0F|nr:response regulator transcription factor [Alcanivorax sp. MD8A]MAX54965.1 helix-turn-helix transcriptional regulator [Alcanivoracaceae bacterium]MCG8438072.1 response regulator transcription factor [Pseudomonadales bacterium]MED5431238.1 response regulator transcription factor [Pseudomonadota bacterium]MEE2869291.1 response regulator transcription factor [Pseudomonadota bacterium]PNE02683.1 LuxR family transcriptional regulator [Alcanivorax sp. MD8A]
MNTQQHSQQVYVVGSQQLQNALLTEFLVKEEIAARSIPSVSDITVATLQEFDQSLFLVDYHSVDVNEVIAHLLEADQEVENDVLIAVFNVDTDESLSKLAGLPMVNGGFQHDCPQALLSKGIKAIFDGELWFPRAVLQAYLMKSRTFNKTFSRSEVNLTDREVEVLKVMATGAKNSEIASSLNLSPHTIKTHIYNIFKKINASNRLQAVNWAQENL